MKATLLFNNTAYAYIESATLQEVYNKAEVYISGLLTNANIAFNKGFRPAILEGQTTGWQLLLDVEAFNRHK